MADFFEKNLPNSTFAFSKKVKGFYFEVALLIESVQSPFVCRQNLPVPTTKNPYA